MGNGLEAYRAMILYLFFIVTGIHKKETNDGIEHISLSKELLLHREFCFLAGLWTPMIHSSGYIVVRSFSKMSHLKFEISATGMLLNHE